MIIFSWLITSFRMGWLSERFCDERDYEFAGCELRFLGNEPVQATGLGLTTASKLATGRPTPCAITF